MAEHEHLVNTIFIGEVATVQSYGAFVRIPGISKQGLIHRSQVSSAPVDDVSDVLNRGDRVYCKVISVTDGKIALSMKLVNQGSGKDLDPNGVQLQKDELRRKTFVPGTRKKIELEAVFNTTCSKCGTRGHMARDCFKSPGGKIYELLPEEDDAENKGEDGLKPPESLPETDKLAEKKTKKKKKEKKTKVCKEKKRKKSKKKKSRKSSSDESSSEDSSSPERETEVRRKKCKRSHSSSSSDEEEYKKRRKHSNSKKKKSRK
ncbi:nucleolar protein of 40 kDa-like [Ischnura elegans]|uniref:nucleolar protein of 40 kDa-like n=1 Tax=Ischnura elegans TaxID=197161 RepID=UPI001ED8BBBA|nr:nucleolar protein of 40 kDa-like [Ischnura elegans]XP_046393559.1 nucleolar protein of 40 kDa-like [Ischnura elegans]